MSTKVPFALEVSAPPIRWIIESSNSADETLTALTSSATTVGIVGIEGPALP
jgi:hypothetical protein